MSDTLAPNEIVRALCETISGRAAADHHWDKMPYAICRGALAAVRRTRSARSHDFAGLTQSDHETSRRLRRNTTPRRRRQKPSEGKLGATGQDTSESATLPCFIAI